MTTSTAQLTVKHPWLAAIGACLVPVAGTIAGAVAGQVSGAGDPNSYLFMAAGIAVAALLGLLVLWRAKPSFADFGFRRPVALQPALWFLPLVAEVVLIPVFTGVTVPPTAIAIFAAVALAAAFSEEIWYRGIVLALLRHKGTRFAVAASSALFAVLHLTNLFGGKSPLYAALQFLFAALFGFVAAEVVALTGSLWPGIAWHFGHDFVSYIGGDDLSTAGLTSVGIGSIILLAYAIWLWRRLPDTAE